jgi:hypothetical protein
MTALSQALQSAGVKLPPLNKRIWLWLHDHPGKTSKEVSVTLGIPTATASSILGIMVKRKMVTVSTIDYNHRNQEVLRYATQGKSFVLLPLPKKPNASTFSTLVATSVQMPEAPKPVKTPLEAIPVHMWKMLDQYKLSDLRLLRDGLNFLFGCEQ